MAAALVAVAVVPFGCAGDESLGEPYSVNDVSRVLHDAGVDVGRFTRFSQPEEVAAAGDEVVGWADADPVFVAVYPDEDSARRRESSARELEGRPLVLRKGNVLVLVEREDASPEDVERARAALADLG
jgi:hypothetical protein